MAEYIERIDFINKLEVINGCVDCNEKCRDCGVNDIKGMLRSIPAADVAPVVHGRWRTIRNVSGFVACDKCGYWCGTKSKYCPDCGAKMDEEELHDR